MVRETALDHQAALHRGKIVRRGPVLRNVLRPHVDRAGFECLQRHGGIAEILDLHAVEIVGSDAGGQLGRPPGGIALEGDAAAEVETRDAVGAGADRRVLQRTGEVAAFEPMLRQHRQPAEHQRQLAVGVGGEVEHHAAGAFHRHVLHVGHLDAEAGTALGQQGAIGPGDVAGGNRRAVGEFRLRPQIEGDPHAVGGESMVSARWQ